MSIGTDLKTKLTQVAALASALPPGASVTVEWSDAPADLVLFVALQQGGNLGPVSLDEGREDQAEWRCGNLVVRARCACPEQRTNKHPRLWLVKP